MPQHVWTVFCYKASIDRDDNSVSLLDVVERIVLHGQKAIAGLEQEWVRAEEKKSAERELRIPAKMEAVSWWVRSDFEKPEEGTARLQTIAPDGKKSRPHEFKIPLESGTGFRMRFQIPFLSFRGFGVYWFVVELKSGNRWRRVARVPLELMRADPPQDSA